LIFPYLKTCQNAEKGTHRTRKELEGFQRILTVVTYWIGLRLIHELTSRKGQTNLILIDSKAANGIKGLDTFNSFPVDAGPGYRIHVGKI